MQRELALYSALKQNLQTVSLTPYLAGGSVWQRVNARVARPVGLVLLLAGAMLWAVYGGYIYYSSSINVWEKIGTSAVLCGIAILFFTVAWERYRSWLVDPYKDVHR